MLDTSLVTISHVQSFLIVFAVLAAGFALKSRSGRQYAGLLLAVIATVAAIEYIPSLQLRIGLIVAATLIAFIGTIDEKSRLGPGQQLLWQVIIASVLVFSGWVIPYVSNPIEAGVIDLNWISIAGIALPGGLFALFWIVLMMNTINWLDGVDGLAGGVTLVGFFALACVALLPNIYNSSALGLALIGAGSVLAFFIFNFPPAKIYLGTVGSWFVGMYIALAAMQGGGKIATTLLILALPVVDVLIVMIRRVSSGQPIWQGDTVHHLHHRLQNAGVSKRQIVLAAMMITTVLACFSILLTPAAKLLAGGVAIMGIVIAALRLGAARLMLKRSQNMNRSYIYIAASALIIVAAVLGVASWISSPNDQGSQGEVDANNMAEVSCADPSGESWNFSEGVLTVADRAINVAIANEHLEKQKGLSGCEGIPEGAGMVFLFSPAGVPTFWMKDTLIPLDIVWIAAGEVLEVTENIQPEPGAPDDQLIRYRPQQAVSAVLELPAGDVAKYGIKAGQTTTFTTRQ